MPLAFPAGLGLGWGRGGVWGGVWGGVPLGGRSLFAKRSQALLQEIRTR
jgi:hypothetical protein